MPTVFALDTPYATSPEQVASLHEKGWARLPGLLDRPTVDGIQAALHRVDTLVPSDAEQWMEDPEYKKVVQLRDGMAWRDPMFHELATSKRLAGTALQLMKATTATFVLDMAFAKPGDGGGGTPMHHDYPHWPFDRRGTITLWIALTDVTADMGPLQFMEGSHHEGPLGRFSTGVGDDIRNEYPWLADRYPVAAGEDLAAGDATVHWDLTMHGTGPNVTSRVRSAYTVRYVPQGTRYTGSPHRHFDQFEIPVNSRFEDLDQFPTITA